MNRQMNHSSRRCHMDGCDLDSDMQLRAGETVIHLCREHAEIAAGKLQDALMLVQEAHDVLPDAGNWLNRRDELKQLTVALFRAQKRIEGTQS